MKQIRLTPRGKKHRGEEWVLQLDSDAVRVLDQDDRVVAEFEPSKAQKRFKQPSFFWDSVKHFGIQLDNGSQEAFDVTAKGKTIIQDYLNSVTLAGGAAGRPTAPLDRPRPGPGGPRSRRRLHHLAHRDQRRPRPGQERFGYDSIRPHHHWTHDVRQGSAQPGPVLPPQQDFGADRRPRRHRLRRLTAPSPARSPRMAGKEFTYPYPRPSVTVDVALVTREARPRVLLIRRGKDPFAGKWAFPGGFVDADEPLVDAARRELREETGLDVARLEQVQAFGDPGRDPRGWTVSVVFLARVSARQLKAVAADDAEAVGWFPVDRPPPLAFDHRDIMKVIRKRVKER